MTKKRPNICTTKKPIQSDRDISMKRTVPGVLSYNSVTDYGKKYLL